MGTILSRRKVRHMNRPGIFLLALVLIVGMAGCAAEAAQYELTILSTAGGVVTNPGEGTATYERGTEVTLVAQAEEGYRFINWTGDVDTVADVEAASTTIVMNGDYSVTANFIALYELTIAGTDGGAVTTPGEGTFTYDAGTVVHLLAEANEGHRFVSWSGDVATVNDVNAAATTIDMNGNHEITAIFEAEQPVHFADANLEAAIREAIGIGERPIYPSDLEGLTTLDAPGRTIENLAGLEHCINLTDLNLSNNQISDISPLANLTNLTRLHLGDWRGGNQISDISPLTDLNNLTELALGNNQISDISPLANLTSLTMLWLYSNQISDISPLASLTSLTLLQLGYNQISDTELLHLTSLTELVSLLLHGNQVSDTSPLVSLISLTHLNLHSNQITDISPLASLTRLTSLDVHSNPISDISPLADLINLTELGLSGHQISDISHVVDLTRLTSLILPYSDISDISLLSDLTNLTSLWTSSNQISDISPLAGLTNLTLLRLHHNQISDISPLAGLINLTWLSLNNNQISDIEPLVLNVGLSQGDRVDLWDNPLSADSISIYIPELEARGVTVDY